MGTRNLTKVIMNGDVVVAHYGQWVGYPAGQGITAFNFLKEKENRCTKVGCWWPAGPTTAA